MRNLSISLCSGLTLLAGCGSSKSEKELALAGTDNATGGSSSAGSTHSGVYGVTAAGGYSNPGFSAQSTSVPPALFVTYYAASISSGTGYAAPSQTYVSNQNTPAGAQCNATAALNSYLAALEALGGGSISASFSADSLKAQVAAVPPAASCALSKALECMTSIIVNIATSPSTANTAASQIQQCVSGVAGLSTSTTGTTQTSTTQGDTTSLLGSCNYPALGMCVELSQSSYYAAAKSPGNAVCTDGASCPTANRVGTCSATMGVYVYYSNYAGIGVTAAQTNCSAQRGSWVGLLSGF